MHNKVNNVNVIDNHVTRDKQTNIMVAAYFGATTSFKYFPLTLVLWYFTMPCLDGSGIIQKF